MKPTEVLMQEHRVIEQVLDCLEKMAQRGETDGKLDLESVHQAVDFFANFADGCHHAKEEECLFPLLEQKGMSPEQGPTSVMRHEHEVGRQLVRQMTEAAEAAASGTTTAIAEFASHARMYVSLLREHIQKEDHCLFQMTNQTLNEEEQAKLMESFDHVEHHDMSPGTHEKYLAIASALSKRFGVECQLPIASTGGGCCGPH